MTKADNSVDGAGPSSFRGILTAKRMSRESDEKMKSNITYRNWLICSGSFRLERKGRWIPQYTLTHQGAKNNESDVGTHHAQLKTSFLSENEADEFALQEAMHWIDTN
jgi:hypothetical protein